MHDSMENRRASIDEAHPTIDFGALLYRHIGSQGYHPAPRCHVIPAGRNFFHIQERASGRTLGFRRSHLEACALAQQLESSVPA
ncbi:hypothetical protein [Pseudomonas sp.]|uniref:Uncharacterized protein n=1 Tax=Pseudomonas eucalypticola TaxID=2599595 RepID=A0A7D5D4W6_9PSED|nr:hypothetical protein [Pseudomonas sp.]QKZ02261.1 hypothetical protein HWQ56_16425 [Pseudomonas eucalypticola]